MRRPAFLAALSALLIGASLGIAATPAGASVIAPESPHSPNADEITLAYWVMFGVGMALIVAINVALVIAIRRFRAGRGVEPARVTAARGAQRRLVAGLSALAVVLFVLGVIFTENAREVEPSGSNGLQAAISLSAQTQPSVPQDAEPLEISVIAQRWLWRYEYPGGRPGDRTFSYQDLVVPVDTTVVLHVTSTDVLHRWWVPALGGKVDAIPGQTQDTWFKADAEGVYEGQSAAFSGPSYPAMRTRVRVVSVEEYQAWLDQQAADLAEAQKIVQDTVDAQAAQADAGESK